MPPIIGFNPNRLKVQLKLAINRIKLAQQKKNVSSKLQRKEIATLLENNKEESARIRVEGIIHDDYYVEAMEVLELYCELLIARFGLLEQMKQCDPSIAEAVNTLLYASSRLDIKELLPIRDQFISKFGKEFVKNAIENVNDCVNERIVQKLIVDNPDPFLVERYLEEIAKSFNVDWKSKHNNNSDKETIDLDDLNIKLNNNNSKEKDEYTALPDLSAILGDNNSNIEKKNKNSENNNNKNKNNNNNLNLIDLDSSANVPKNLPQSSPSPSSKKSSLFKLDDDPPSPISPPNEIINDGNKIDQDDDGFFVNKSSSPSPLPPPPPYTKTTTNKKDEEFDDLMKRFEALKRK